MKLAEAYAMRDRDDRAAEVLLEVIRTDPVLPSVAARCIAYLDRAGRVDEASNQIKRLRPTLSTEPVFFAAWARHALRNPKSQEIKEIASLETLNKLEMDLIVRVLFGAGMREEATAVARNLLRDLDARALAHTDVTELAGIFAELDLWEDFEREFGNHYPQHLLKDLKTRSGRVRRSGRP
jgi:hypothetical protein